VSRLWEGLAGALLVVQGVLALRVVMRLMITAGGSRIVAVRPHPSPSPIAMGEGLLRATPSEYDRAYPETPHASAPLPSQWERGRGEGGCVTILVPVLNEADRLAPCLVGLSHQGADVAEILVVDGGSTDGTQEIVAALTANDPRIRLLASPPHAPGINGKAHNLVHGLAHADLGSRWILTIDADVRPGPGLVEALLLQAEHEEVPALSVATRQRLSGQAEALLHPAMLTTLVYRFGIPGRATADPAMVQANGQCFLVRRETLLAVGGFSRVLDSVCEDVTLARLIAAAGHRVGFYEADGEPVSVAMYAGAAEAWRNWLRSLPMRDRFWGRSGWLGLAEVVLVQAAPLPIALLFGRRAGIAGMLGRFNVLLLTMRLGVLAGTARAYVSRPWTYWLSPVYDLPVALGVLLSAMRRVHSWRGRPVTRGEPR
jgi:dolichol-phosphate mannosyltransferase